MHELSKEIKIDLLKGAGHAVDRQAIGIVKSYGLSILDKIAKSALRGRRYVSHSGRLLGEILRPVGAR